MIYVDTKQLARFERVGHRITGNRRLGSSPGACYEKAHVAVDDATRLAYVEVLPDEQQTTTVGFLVRAVSWFNSQGITCQRVLSDNGSAYRSKQWLQPAAPWALRENAPGRTGRKPTARPSGVSRHCRPSVPMPCRSTPQRRESGGYLGIYPSITAVRTTWQSMAALTFSSSNGCGSLNNLVRKHN